MDDLGIQQSTTEKVTSDRMAVMRLSTFQADDKTPNNHQKSMGQAKEGNVLFADTKNRVVAFRVSDKASNTFTAVADDSWQALWLDALENDPRSSVFQHPAYVLNERAITHQHPVIILILEINGRDNLAILKPVLQDRRLGFGYLPGAKFRGYLLAGKRFIGSDFEKSATLLFSALPKLLSEYSSSLLLIEDVEEQTALWKALNENETSALKQVVVTTPRPKHRIRLSDGSDAYWSQFSKSTRKEFKRILKKNTEATFSRITEPEQVDHFLAQAHQVSANSWQANVYGNRVNNDDVQKNTFKRLAEQGMLRCYLMSIGEKPIAFEIAYSYKDYVYGIEVGFDQSYRKISPGNLLMYKEIEDLFEHETPEWYDFGEGDAPYKARFSTVVTSSANIWMIEKNLKNNILLAIIEINTTLEKSIHWLLDKSGLKENIRRLYRNIGKKT